MNGSGNNGMEGGSIALPLFCQVLTSSIGGQWQCCIQIICKRSTLALYGHRIEVVRYSQRWLPRKRGKALMALCEEASGRTRSDCARCGRMFGRRPGRCRSGAGREYKASRSFLHHVQESWEAERAHHVKSMLVRFSELRLISS